VLESVEWERTHKELEAALWKKFPAATTIDPAECGAGRLLQAYAAGRPVAPETVAAVPLDWDRLRGFPRKVLQELASIPYGETITYGKLAARAGSGKAARAVGAAMSRNPWPVIVPCHRVVGEGGAMVGFGRGIAAKKILLAFEEKNLAAVPQRPRNRQIA
jgi:methylated-DNA-[protein]-cysteine S-methyltransferase